MEVGHCKDEKCNRDNCKGIIKEKEIEGCCSCHISPPCGYCTEPKNYCPECDWDQKEENNKADQKNTDYWTDYNNSAKAKEDREKAKEREDVFNKMYRGDMKVEEYQDRHKSHTHFSQIIYGVHPNMSRAEITEKVKGTFGGRFKRFCEFSFEYVAYTD